MALREEFESSGNWLFRRRSYLPLLLFVPLLVDMIWFRTSIGRPDLQIAWEYVCIAVSFSGLVVRALTIGFRPAGTSGRNTHAQVAEQLNTSGMYSIVRHPLYVGNFLMWIGVGMFNADWRLVAFFIVAFALYYERIMYAEEEFLRRKFGTAYTDWAEHTPAFFPRLSAWRPPTLKFSLRSVLRHEYSSFFAMIVAFVILGVVQHLVAYGRFAVETRWIVLGAVGLVVYVTLRTMKKRTRLLAVEGR